VANRQRVLGRLESGIIRAKTGLEQVRECPGAVATELNPTRRD
jgi:hypothetical protein